MKKITNLLICLLIIAMISPINISIGATISANNSYGEIRQHYYSGEIKNASEEVLSAWLTTIEKYENENSWLVSNEEAYEELNEIREEIKFEFNDTIGYWTPTNSGGNDKIKKMTGKIVGFIQSITSYACVGVLAIIGMKYMYASVEEKAKYKETMLPYVVGCILVFGISQVTSLIYDIADYLW